MNYEQPSNLFNEEICSLIDSIKPNQKQKSKNFPRMRQLEIIPEDKSKQFKKTAEKGLTENILNDFETKEKARKGLLFLLNKISEGSFCPEIADYYSQAKKENLQKQREIAKSLKKEEEKYSPLNKMGSNLKRQNLVEATKSVSKFRLSQEEIFKLNCDTPQTMINTKKNDDKFIQKEKEKVTLKLKKRKDGENKKVHIADKFFPEKKYKNDISAHDKEFKLYFSDNDEDKNPKFKSKGKKKYLGVNNYTKIKHKSKKDDQRRAGVYHTNLGIDSVKQNNNNLTTKNNFVERDLKKNFTIGCSSADT